MQYEIKIPFWYKLERNDFDSLGPEKAKTKVSYLVYNRIGFDELESYCRLGNMMEWLDANTADWKFESKVDNVLSNLVYFNIFLVFEKQEDAVAFKLGWL